MIAAYQRISRADGDLGKDGKDKVPAIQVEFRRMLSFEDENGGKLSYTLNGTLYPDEQVVIYDIGDVKPEAEKKRRGRRKKSEIEAEQKED